MLPFHSSLTIQTYAAHLNILTNKTTAFGFTVYSANTPKYLVGSSPVGWSVENNNTDVTS